MSEAKPCAVCHGLGFRSLNDADLYPEFNVWGMTRRVHRNGKVTWEGDCAVCRGTGDEPEKPQPQQSYWARINPFGWLHGL